MKETKSRKMQYAGALSEEAALTGETARKSDSYADLNFKVDPDFKTEYKISATTLGLSMKELLKASYDLFLQESSKGNPAIDEIIRRAKDR